MFPTAMIINKTTNNIVRDMKRNEEDDLHLHPGIL